MPIPKLSETTIRHHATAQSYDRGEAYYRSGAVVTLIQRGNTLLAQIEGNEVHPYRVRLSFDDGGIKEAKCTCLYDLGGWCKHIVAALLVCLRDSERIEQRPSLERLLDCLDLVQTQRLIQDLVAKQPELIDSIDRFLNSIAKPTPPQPQQSKPKRQTTIDPKPFRQEAQQILRDGARYLEYGEESEEVTDNLLDLIQSAQEFSERGDGNNAIVILEAITDACVANWDEVDEYGLDNYEVASALNTAITEAILTAQLTSEEQVDLKVNLEAWQDEWNASFEMSLAALHQGWDYPPLKSVLQGNITEKGAWEQEAPDFSDDLALIRLQILERQQKYQEFLYLAQAEGQTERYLTMLASLGRIEEAMQAAKTEMQSMNEAFALAKTLQEQGALAPALEIAQTGLTLPGNCEYELAIWTSNLAEGLGDNQVALAARVQAFKAKPEFGDYRLAESLAEESWEEVKPDLLASLRQHTGWDAHEAKVNIFLEEELIDDAIAVVTNFASYNESLVQRVMEKAVRTHPDWVIENATRRAESIIDRGKAEAYDRAVDWLKLARNAYQEVERQSDWSEYRTKLTQTHARKHKLMTLLKSKGLN